MRVGGCATTCVDMLWGSGHSVAAVRRSSVSGSLARDQVLCPILYVLLLLALETRVGKRSGRENPHNTSSPRVWKLPEGRQSGP